MATRRENLLRRRAEWKAAAVVALGGCCVCCGETHVDYLQFDHIDEDASKDVGIRSQTLFRQVALRLRDDIQLLCANCHQVKSLKARGIEASCKH